MDVETKWAGRSEFAEVAEALGVPTDHVIGTLDDHQGHETILYTREVDASDPEAMIYAALLVRDEDGVLQRATPEREYMTLGQLLRDLDALGHLDDQR